MDNLCDQVLSAQLNSIKWAIIMSHAPEALTVHSGLLEVDFFNIMSDFLSYFTIISLRDCNRILFEISHRFANDGITDHMRSQTDFSTSKKGFSHDSKDQCCTIRALLQFVYIETNAKFQGTLNLSFISTTIFLSQSLSAKKMFA